MHFKKIFFCKIIFFCWACVATLPDLVQYPTYCPPTHYDFKQNFFSAAQINLGKALFYDNILSADNSISCASCHSPYHAFAHTDHALSHGINDQVGHRNAPALFNLAWQSFLMWDGAIQHLDMQALAPITSSKEMNSDINQIVEKLNQSSIYPTLFYNAYKDSVAAADKILKSLAAFQLTLLSFDSKYDQVRQKKTKFTNQEQQGYQLFLQHCNTCHTEPLFTNFAFANNGLNIDTTLNDFGKYEISLLQSDSFLFKIPSLRNLSYTYPYMHDGRFRKLSQVLNHYSHGIKNRTNLSPLLKNNLQISADEKVDIIAFLLTLDDKTFVFNPSHQFPRNLLLPK